VDHHTNHEDQRGRGFKKAEIPKILINLLLDAFLDFSSTI